MRIKPKSTVAFYQPIRAPFAYLNAYHIPMGAAFNYTNLKSSDIEDLVLSPYNLKTIMEVITCLLLFVFTYHRLLAYVSLWFIRLWLSRSIFYTGAFDAHCEWIAVRGMFPNIEVVIRNFCWRNPAQFKKTPYLLYCQHFRIQLNLYNWYKTFRYGRTCKYGSIEVVSLEIFHEKIDRGTEDESLNLWVALGAEDADSESEWLKLLFKTLWASVRRKIMGVLLRNAMRGGKDLEEEEDEDMIDEDAAELHRLYDAHFEDDEDDEDGQFSETGSEAASDAGTGTFDSIRDATKYASSTNKRRYSMNTNVFGKRRNSKPSVNPTVTAPEATTSLISKFDWRDPFWSVMRILAVIPMEMESFNLQNFVMHPLSLVARLSSYTAELSTKTSTSFRIKMFHLNHRQMTGTNPKHKKGKRIPLLPKYFIDKVGEHIVKAVIMDNSLRLFTIAAALGLQSILHSMGYFKRMQQQPNDINLRTSTESQSETGGDVLWSTLNDFSDFNKGGSEQVSVQAIHRVLSSFREMEEGIEIDNDDMNMNMNTKLDTNRSYSTDSGQSQESRRAGNLKISSSVLRTSLDSKEAFLSPITSSLPSFDVDRSNSVK